MKTTLLISTLMLASVFADFAEEDLVAARPKKNLPPAPPPAPERVVLTSAAPKSEHGWYLFADALYWHADEGDGDWAFKDKLMGNTNAGLGNLNAGPTHSLRFKWDWAYRVGFGMNMAYDGWDAAAYYTWFHTDNSNGFGAKEGDQIGSDLDLIVGPFISGKMNWFIHYSMFDVDLGRPFFVSERVVLKPHAGIRGGWIHQGIHKHFNRGTLNVDQTRYFRDSFHNDFWGVGPSAGFMSAWTFAQMQRDTFKVIGDFGGALMYGRFELSHKLKGFDSSGVNETIELKQGKMQRNLAAAELQGMLALNWNRTFNQEKCLFGLKIGYEFQVWFRQLHQVTNEVLQSNTVVAYDLTPQDLVLQGVTIDFRFDY